MCHPPMLINLCHCETLGNVAIPHIFCSVVTVSHQPFVSELVELVAKLLLQVFDG